MTQWICHKCIPPSHNSLFVISTHVTSCSDNGFWNDIALCMYALNWNKVRKNGVETEMCSSSMFQPIYLHIFDLWIFRKEYWYLLFLELHMEFINNDKCVDCYYNPIWSCVLHLNPGAQLLQQVLFIFVFSISWSAGFLNEWMWKMHASASHSLAMDETE